MKTLIKNMAALVLGLSLLSIFGFIVTIIGQLAIRYTICSVTIGTEDYNACMSSIGSWFFAGLLVTIFAIVLAMGAHLLGSAVLFPSKNDNQ